MISSAVVIPEEAPPPRSPSSLKRRQSSISEDTNKRPRIEKQHSHGDGSPIDHAAIAEPASPPARRKSSAIGNGAAEERKRGQRLFGALLGTLSQTSSKSVHRKRDEIEQKQRERLRRDVEEREEERKRKRADLDKIRRVEQKAWDEEGARIQRRNARAMANFLQTKTEPRLYYRPWELRPEEEEQIKRQLSEVEGSTGEESRVVVGSTNGTNNTNSSDRADVEHAPQSAAAIAHANGPDDQHMSEGESSLPLAESAGQQDENAQIQTSTEDAAQSRHEHNKDDDHGGGELVEGQEDDVMY